MVKIIEFFIKDEYKVLKVLIENETKVMGKDIVPLSQDNISNLTHFSKAKVNSIMNELLNEKYISVVANAKYQISKDAKNIYSFFETRYK